MGALTLYYTVGLPGSGKSTVAHRMVSESGGSLVEISRDDIREFPDAPRAVKAREKWARVMRDCIVCDALCSGLSIVVHDTNLEVSTRERLEQLAREHGATVEVVDLRDVPLDTCIERDRLRSRHVGETVIRSMWQRHLYAPPVSVPSDLPPAVLVDIDGTLARMGERSPYDFTRVGEDAPVPHVVELVRDLHRSGTEVVFMSGREESCRVATEVWISEHVGVPGPLHMRPCGDMRPDSVVKSELFDRHVSGRVRVRFVLDDRDSVVFMWRSRGLPVLQVEYGTF